VSENAHTAPDGFLVKGTRASSYEYNLALALDFYRVPFLFQVDYFGGRSLRGGQVLDFLVLAPFGIPCQVFGEYWHTGQLASSDRLKLQYLEAEFGQKVIVLWGPDTSTYEAALNSVRRYFV